MGEREENARAGQQRASHCGRKMLPTVALIVPASSLFLPLICRPESKICEVKSSRSSRVGVVISAEMSRPASPVSTARNCASPLRIPSSR